MNHLTSSGLAGRPENNQSQPCSYKVTIAKVLPRSLKASLNEYQQCVFIVSLGSKNYIDHNRLEASISWISQHFHACTVLVCDSIYRLTLEVNDQISGQESRTRAFYTGQEFIEQNTGLFQRYSAKCRFIFKPSSEIEQHPDFKAYYQEFQDLCKTSESFNKLVNAFAENYLSRGQRTEEERSGGLLRQKKHLAITYLLEESALFTCLVQEGWQVFIYPGSIRTFEEIAEGLHPQVPPLLQRIVWVSLRLRSRPLSDNS